MIVQSLPSLSVLVGNALATNLDFYDMIYTIIEVISTSCNVIYCLFCGQAFTLGSYPT
ncbi:hypothetical protein NTGZN8_250003 [Candidatus Nitrotoga fabula]|uniref:Uncharacterized protein n=1 Tax=Candidatus Nitrotoga fabula TaxID=2182327 RepID=A0A916BDP1_9PROT|nr:hypothetical protein NTGZN8_250003 [Candidatus Nitrotoga fabula]